VSIQKPGRRAAARSTGANGWSAMAVARCPGADQAPRAMAVGEPAGQRLGDAPHQVLQRQGGRRTETDR